MKTPFLSKLIGEIVFLLLKIGTCLPSVLYSYLACCISSLLVMIDFSPSRYFDRNVFHVLGYKPKSREYYQFKKEYIKHQVHCTIESFVGMMWSNKIKFDKSNHKISEHIPTEKPTILITGHIGAWELLSDLLEGFKNPLLLAKPTKYLWANYVLDKMRSKNATRILWVESDLGSYKSILKALKNNQAVGFVFDQKSKNRKGPQVNFLGYETDFVSGPALFARKTGAEIGEMYCLREGRFKYSLHSNYLDLGNKMNDVNAMTQFLASEFEKKVKEYPAQWLWQYHKWTNFN